MLIKKRTNTINVINLEKPSLCKYSFTTYLSPNYHSAVIIPILHGIEGFYYKYLTLTTKLFESSVSPILRTLDKTFLEHPVP